VSLFEPSDGANQAWICEEAKAGLSWRVPLKLAFSTDRARQDSKSRFRCLFLALDSRSHRNDVWLL